MPPKRKIEYSKMHLITQGMYEKLLKCIEEDDDKQNPPSDITQSTYDVPDDSDDPMVVDDPSVSYNPIPGPSNINPETGEYYEMPTEIPPEFQYSESTIDPTGDIVPETPHDSMFESYDSDTGTHHKQKKGKKTNDPTKIKSSAKIRTMIPVRVRSRRDLVYRPSLSNIPEERSLQHSTHRELDYSRLNIPALEYRPDISRSFGDVSFDSPPRPLRTSTPKPSQIPRLVKRPRIQNLSSFEESSSRQVLPLPIESSPAQTRSKIKQLPLKSCNSRPKVKVTVSDGDEKILDKPNLGKFKCPYCERYLSTKYALNRHIQRVHSTSTDKTPVSSSDNRPPSPPPPPPSNSDPNFSKWVQLGKRTSSEAKLKQHQQQKYKENPAQTKKRFDTWNL